MENTPQLIDIGSLLIGFIPVLAVVALSYHWTTGGTESLYALARMLGQLLIVGYFLAYIFQAESAWVVLALLAVMVCVSSWIALRTVKLQRRRLYLYSFAAILGGGGLSLAVASQAVLAVQPFYAAQVMIPLAGMAFANAMNSVSICAERYQSERDRGVALDEARELAFKAAMIPITNALFAVGLVSFPGMMTGQILAGVDPLIAARYQIMVMCMLFSCSGLSAACFLFLLQRRVG